MKLSNMTLVALLAAGVAGCGGETDETAMEKAIERETGEETRVAIEADGMRIDAEGGALSIASGSAATVPDDFPADVHVYAHGDLQMAVRSPEGFTLSMSTTDEPDAVVDTYSAAMDQEDWTVQSSFDMGAQRVLVYEKDDRIANVAVAAVGGATQVTVTVTGE